MAQKSSSSPGCKKRAATHGREARPAPLCRVMQVLLLASTFTGVCCVKPQQKVPSNNTLSPADARQALVAMIESSDDMILTMALPFLKTAPVEPIGAHSYTIGAFRFDTQTRTFLITAHGGDAGFTEYEGEFSSKGGNTWTARVVSTRNASEQPSGTSRIPVP